MTIGLKIKLATLGLAIIASQSFASLLIPQTFNGTEYFESGIIVADVADIEAFKEQKASGQLKINSTGNSRLFKLEKSELIEKLEKTSSGDSPVVVGYIVHAVTSDILNKIKNAGSSILASITGSSDVKKEGSGDEEIAFYFPNLLWTSNEPWFGNNKRINRVFEQTAFNDRESGKKYGLNPVQDSQVTADLTYVAAGSVVAVGRYSGGKDDFKDMERSCYVKIASKDKGFFDFYTYKEEICEYAEDSAIARQPVIIKYVPSGAEENLVPLIAAIQPESVSLETVAVSHDSEPLPAQLPYDADPKPDVLLNSIRATSEIVDDLRIRTNNIGAAILPPSPIRIVKSAFDAASDLAVVPSKAYDTIVGSSDVTEITDNNSDTVNNAQPEIKIQQPEPVVNSPEVVEQQVQQSVPPAQPEIKIQQPEPVVNSPEVVEQQVEQSVPPQPEIKIQQPEPVVNNPEIVEQQVQQSAASASSTQKQKKRRKKVRN